MVETSPRYVMLFFSAAFVCRSALDEDGAGDAQRGENCMHSHFYALGQQVSYAEDGIAWPWKGGFEATPSGPPAPTSRLIGSAMPSRPMTVSCASTSSARH